MKHAIEERAKGEGVGCYRDMHSHIVRTVGFPVFFMWEPQSWIEFVYAGRVEMCCNVMVVVAGRDGVRVCIA
jgi:hypothetical protein